MIRTSRRQFLSRVGGGIGSVALGYAFADRLGLSRAFASLAPERLRFGALDPLVDLMQATPADELMVLLVAKLRAGTTAAEVVGAAALANARALGSTDYNGYHALMALLPSYSMTAQMAPPLEFLPLLKVVHRNARFVRDAGHAQQDALDPVEAAADGPSLVESMHRRDVAAAEKKVTALAARAPLAAYEELQRVVREDANVHRVVLAWRAGDLQRVVGEQHAATLLRQPVRYCIDEDSKRDQRGGATSLIGSVTAKLVDEHHLADRAPGKRKGDDAWIASLSETILESDGTTAAQAVAAALAEGFDPEDVGTAMSLAATNLLLRDPGRKDDTTGKPRGSVHGASVGVHASDSANAWRHIARVGSAENRAASLIAGAFHTAGQLQQVGDLPFDHAGAACTLADPAELLREIDGSIRERDQSRATLAARRYCELGHAADALFRTLLPFAVSQDGALHHEKYFWTVTEEHAAARAAHRPLYLAALTRVMASGYGFPAPGCEEVRQLLSA